MTSTLRGVAPAVATAFLLAGCSASADESDSAVISAPTSAARVEAAGPTPRLAVTHDGGVTVLDAATLEAVDEFPLEGFTRLDPAGDGRHVLITAASRFAVLDTGAWTDQHGDHGHSYTAPPVLADWSFDADGPGHVVTHAGVTVLFADGTGRIESFDPRELAEGRPETRVEQTPEAHHGVAVALPGGGLVTTIGNEASRSGIVVLDRDRNEVTRNEQCPGVHGEAAAADGALVFGCQDGVLVHRDGVITKVQSPDAYGRIGNQAGSDASPIVLGDYKTEPDAELERPQRVMLLDTVANRLTPVDLGTSYSFRSLGRGPQGEALVLGTDGALHVIDPVTATVTRTIDVVDAWTEPVRWQDPRPTLFVEGATAYVTEPAATTLHAVDLTTGAVVASVELAEIPNEITGVSG
ncbi:zinc metallochaperone AztD [Rhodococcus sp. NPDC003318]|uniref:zinc metallochaperone AztD n=1 Tax=Rhodococcus sp. NPDC003318 TaxID=3364503 RepID=UPI0036C8365B